MFECTVVNDLVEEWKMMTWSDWFTIEDTDDWYIQHKSTGDVLYMGEIARDYELDLDENAGTRGNRGFLESRPGR